MYTVRFQLELSGSEKRFLSKSFFYANQMHNQLVRYATNRLKALFHDKEYVGARKAYGEAEAVYKGVEKVLFEDGRHLHYRRYNSFDCIKQKCAATDTPVAGHLYVDVCISIILEKTSS